MAGKEVVVSTEFGRPPLIEGGNPCASQIEIKRNGERQVRTFGEEGGFVVRTDCFYSQVEGHEVLVRQEILLNRKDSSFKPDGKSFSRSEEKYNTQTGTQTSHFYQEYDPETKQRTKLIVTTFNQETGERLFDLEEEFEPASGKLVDWTKQKYDPQSGRLVSAETRRFSPANKKLTSWVQEGFNEDNQVVASTAEEFDPETGMKTSQEVFRCDRKTGRRLWRKKEIFNGVTGQPVHKIHEEHEPPGPMRTSCLEEEFDPDGKLKLRKETKYNPETFLRISEKETVFDSQTGKPLSQTIKKFNPQNNKLLYLEEGKYKPGIGIYLERHREYDPQTGRQINWKVATFDPLLGVVLHRVVGKCDGAGVPTWWLIQSQFNPVTAQAGFEERIELDPKTYKRIQREVERFDPASGRQTFGLKVDYDQAGHPTSRKVTLKRT